uniref:Uncharacterized protein n=1 Tax=Arundo donax TaxID=35708 RepID=A0A0A9BUC1_ARUDO
MGMRWLFGVWTVDCCTNLGLILRIDRIQNGAAVSLSM